MQLVKIIRKKAGLTQWGMMKALKKPSFQSYQYLEKESGTIKLKDLTRLYDIAAEHAKMSLGEFWELVTREAEKERKKKK